MEEYSALEEIVSLFDLSSLSANTGVELNIHCFEEDLQDFPPRRSVNYFKERSSFKSTELHKDTNGESRSHQLHYSEPGIKTVSNLAEHLTSKEKFNFESLSIETVQSNNCLQDLNFDCVDSKVVTESDEHREGIDLHDGRPSAVSTEFVESKYLLDMTDSSKLNPTSKNSDAIRNLDKCTATNKVELILKTPQQLDITDGIAFQLTQQEVTEMESQTGQQQVVEQLIVPKHEIIENTVQDRYNETEMDTTDYPNNEENSHNFGKANCTSNTNCSNGANKTNNTNNTNGTNNTDKISNLSNTNNNISKTETACNSNDKVNNDNTGNTDEIVLLRGKAETTDNTENGKDKSTRNTTDKKESRLFSDFEAARLAVQIPQNISYTDSLGELESEKSNYVLSTTKETNEKTCNSLSPKRREILIKNSKIITTYELTERKFPPQNKTSDATGKCQEINTESGEIIDEELTQNERKSAQSIPDDEVSVNKTTSSDNHITKIYLAERIKDKNTVENNPAKLNEDQNEISQEIDTKVLAFDSHKTTKSSFSSNGSKYCHTELGSMKNELTLNATDTIDFEQRNKMSTNTDSTPVAKEPLASEHSMNITHMALRECITNSDADYILYNQKGYITGSGVKLTHNQKEYNKENDVPWIYSANTGITHDDSPESYTFSLHKDDISADQSLSETELPSESEESRNSDHNSTSKELSDSGLTDLYNGNGDIDSNLSNSYSLSSQDDKILDEILGPLKFSTIDFKCSQESGPNTAGFQTIFSANDTPVKSNKQYYELEENAEDQIRESVTYNETTLEKISKMRRAIRSALMYDQSEKLANEIDEILEKEKTIIDESAVDRPIEDEISRLINEELKSLTAPLDDIRYDNRPTSPKEKKSPEDINRDELNIEPQSSVIFERDTQNKKLKEKESTISDGSEIINETNSHNATNTNETIITETTLLNPMPVSSPTNDISDVINTYLTAADSSVPPTAGHKELRKEVKLTEKSTINTSGIEKEKTDCNKMKTVQPLGLQDRDEYLTNAHRYNTASKSNVADNAINFDCAVPNLHRYGELEESINYVHAENEFLNNGLNSEMDHGRNICQRSANNFVESDSINNNIIIPAEDESSASSEYPNLRHHHRANSVYLLQGQNDFTTELEFPYYEQQKRQQKQQKQQQQQQQKQQKQLQHTTANFLTSFPPFKAESERDLSQPTHHLQERSCTVPSNNSLKPCATRSDWNYNAPDYRNKFQNIRQNTNSLTSERLMNEEPADYRLSSTSSVDYDASRWPQNRRSRLLDRSFMSEGVDRYDSEARRTGIYEFKNSQTLSYTDKRSHRSQQNYLTYSEDSLERPKRLINNSVANKKKNICTQTESISQNSLSSELSRLLEERQRVHRILTRCDLPGSDLLELEETKLYYNMGRIDGTMLLMG